MSGTRHTVKLPKLGDTVDEVRVIEWLVAVGDAIDDGAPLMIVETDKVDADVPSPITGQVVELLVEPDAEIAVGTSLCVIQT